MDHKTIQKAPTIPSHADQTPRASSGGSSFVDLAFEAPSTMSKKTSFKHTSNDNGSPYSLRQSDLAAPTDELPKRSPTTVRKGKMAEVKLELSSRSSSSATWDPPPKRKPANRATANDKKPTFNTALPPEQSIKWNSATDSGAWGGRSRVDNGGWGRPRNEQGWGDDKKLTSTASVKAPQASGYGGYPKAPQSNQQPFSQLDGVTSAFEDPNYSMADVCSPLFNHAPLPGYGIEQLYPAQVPRCVEPDENGWGPCRNPTMPSTNVCVRHARPPPPLFNTTMYQPYAEDKRQALANEHYYLDPAHTAIIEPN
jgi:hypothetical protein